MKKITFFIVSVICITACNNEIVIDQKKEISESYSIELRMPEATKVSVYSEATESECTIDSIWVLEFDKGTAKLKNYELVKSGITNNGYATQLLPKLSFKPDNGNLIICIANCDTIKQLDNNLKESDINNYFSPSSVHKYYVEGEALPMYGKFTWATLRYTCEMTRAVAKIQIQMGTGVSDVTGNFKAENVSYNIFNHGDGGFIQPNNNLGIAKTSLGFSSTATLHLLQNDAAGINKTVYLYEYPTGATDVFGNPVNKEDFAINRQHIILEKNDGTNPATYYYRLDFYNNNADTFFHTKRNHHYLFTINKVRSEGYTSLKEAQDNPGSNIEYEVEIKDNSQSITSNGQYAIVTSVDTAYVPIGTIVTDYTIATAKYVIPQGLGVPTTNTITVHPGTMTLGTNSITKLNTSYGNINVNTTDASFTEGVITFTLGNITHRLPVKAK
ncbi:MAG: hypothetical protein LBF05_00490 [Tannerella sp.]|jgi:hypothetical protein|nr:hypothetical protein [Tannerella sp.]